MSDPAEPLDLDAAMAIVRRRTPGEWTQALDLPSPVGNPDKRFIWSGSMYIGGMQTEWLSYEKQHANVAAVVTAVNNFEAVAERCKRAEAANEARLAEVEQIAELTRQRDELVAALQAFVAYYDQSGISGDDVDDDDDECFDGDEKYNVRLARQTMASVKGGADGKA